MNLEELKLYQTIRFNRPIDKDRDYICTGGYELVFLTKSGELPVQFDFKYFESHIDDNDPCILHCHQEHADISAFPEMAEITEDMLSNISSVVDWFVYVERDGKCNADDAIIPVSVEHCEFELISNGNSAHFNLPEELRRNISF